jgi:hypothetical protein
MDFGIYFRSLFPVLDIIGWFRRDNPPLGVNVINRNLNSLSITLREKPKVGPI